MTKAQLNAAIKKFAQQIKAGKIEPYSEAARAEFDRLHGADNSFKSLNADSLRSLIALNRTYNYKKHHEFAGYVQL